MIEVEDNAGNIWETEWDDMDRPTKLTDARSKFTNLSYVDGLLEYIEAPTNNGSGANRRKTEFSYDDSSRMIKTESYIGVSTKQMRVRYEFDGHSNLTKLVRLLGGSETDGTLYEHDKLNRLTEVTDPEGRETTIAPQPFCGGMTETTARGVIRDYSLDHLCRLTELNTGTDSENPTSEKHEFEFDPLGRLTKVIQTEVARYAEDGVSPPRVKRRFGSALYSKGGLSYAEEERFFEYDALDRLTKVTFPGAETIEYGYDLEGNLTSMTDTEGNVTEYDYLNDNRLWKVTIIRPSQSDRVFTYSYDTAGRLDKIIYPSETGIEVHFDDGASGSGWNANGQLVQMRYVKDDGMSGFDPVVSFEYEYDDSGNRTAMVEDNGVPAEKIRWEYAYDWLDRLVEVKRGVGASPTMTTQRVYEYDESDNRTYMDDHLSSTSYRYVYNDADELEKVQEATGGDFESRTPGDYSDVETFTFDADGNMTSRTVGSDVTSYEWSDFNSLIAVEHPNGDKVVNLYDSGGLRKERVFDDGEKVKSFFSGLPTANESSSNGNSFSYLVGHQLMGFEDQGGNFNYFVTDGLTSVRLVLNNSGTAVASYEHDEFGNLLSTPSSVSPKTFVGGLGVHDDTQDTGLLYMRRRHYASSLGRFLNRDPIGFAGGLNLYNYVENSPITYIDPEGLQHRKGSKAWCEELEETLRNLRDEIVKRINDLNINKYNQPFDCPGAPLSRTVMGHILVLDQAYDRYKNRVAQWYQYCGPNPPPFTFLPVPELKPRFVPGDTTVPATLSLPQPWWDSVTRSPNTIPPFSRRYEQQSSHWGDALIFLFLVGASRGRTLTGGGASQGVQIFKKAAGF